MGIERQQGLDHPKADQADEDDQQKDRQRPAGIDAVGGRPRSDSHGPALACAGPQGEDGGLRQIKAPIGRRGILDGHSRRIPMSLFHIVDVAMIATAVAIFAAIIAWRPRPVG